MKGVIYPKDFNSWGTIQDEQRLLALNPHLCFHGNKPEHQGEGS